MAEVYNDERFNSNIDEQTGYTTRSILCMPICIRGTVIGVVQMINKKTGEGIFTRVSSDHLHPSLYKFIIVVFCQQDEESFKTFAVYCGLALHHAKLYDKIRKAESNVQVGQELCAYYSQARQEEVDLVVAEGKPRQEDHEDIRTQM